jgi:DNA-binding NarL/FixJ family response regulator
MPGLQPAHRLAQQRSGPSPGRTDTDLAGTEKGQAEAPRIMIVEDDYLVACEVGEALADAGFDVVGVARSAKEAMDVAAATLPVLVVMDIRIQGPRDGVDAALELFEAHGIRSVFATAHHDAEVRGRAGPAKPLGWIPKPYSMPSLIDVVRNALRILQDQETGGRP